MREPKVGEVWGYKFSTDEESYHNMGTITYISPTCVDIKNGFGLKHFNRLNITFVEKLKPFHGMSHTDLSERQRFVSRFTLTPKVGEFWYVRTSEYLARIVVIYFGTTVVEFKHPDKDGTVIVLRESIEFLERADG